MAQATRARRFPPRWAWRWPAISPARVKTRGGCGDAAFTNGISFEALNNIGQQTKAP